MTDLAAELAAAAMSEFEARRANSSWASWTAEQQAEYHAVYACMFFAEFVQDGVTYTFDYAAAEELRRRQCYLTGFRDGGRCEGVLWVNADGAELICPACGTWEC
jgi:hypothetical protein